MEHASASSLSIQDYWAIVKRRRWWLVVPLVISALVGVWYAKKQPMVYEASTVILVNSPSIPTEYVMEPERSIEVRLSKIRREILKSENIHEIIREFQLFSDAAKEGPPVITDQMVQEVRSAIQIRTLKTNITTGGGRKKSLDGFVLSYRGKHPETVMKLDNRLAELFIEENRRRKEKFVESTSLFLDTELGNLRNKLERQEKKISEFKGRFVVELPDQLGANLRSRDTYQQDLAETSDELEILQEHKALLEEKLPEVAAGETIPTAIEIRLNKLKDNLLQLRGVFKENYPDVIAIKEEIRVLEGLITRGFQPGQSNQDEIVFEPDTLFMDQAYKNLQNEIFSTDVKVKALEERQIELTRLVNLYQDRADRAPVREQKLLSLMRDYDNTKKRYSSLVDKRLKVEISENLQRLSEENQFRIYQEATLPEKPLGSDLWTLIFTAIGYGAATGVGLMMLLEYSDTSFHKTDDVERVSGLRVLCTVPKFTRAQIKSTTSGLRRQTSGPTSVFLNDPQSVAAEQYRFLCGRIQQHFKGSVPKVFGITSSVVAEGKSTTALNLALAFSTDFRKKTILIDADLHKPGIEWGGAKSGKKGLVEVLSGEIPLESALVGVRSHSLTILPKGNVLNANIIDLVTNKTLSDLIRQLKGYYDYVLVDCPPLLQAASTGLIMELMDGLVYVIRADETPRSLVLKASETLEEEKIIGIVFNGVKESEMPKKYYYTHTYSNV